MLKGSTIIEALTAMVIISLIFGISLDLYLNIAQNDNNYLRYRAIVEMDRVYYKTLSEKNFNDDVTESDGITVEKKILPYTHASHVRILQCTARDRKERTLYEKRWIIPVE